LYKPFYIVFFVFFSLYFGEGWEKAYAQVNLVPNPSFEQYDSCPSFLHQLNRCTHWFIPTQATPDYMNVCGTIPDVQCPKNLVGYQQPRTGDGYIGLIYVSHDLGSNCEYASVKLSEKLKSGKTYIIEFYVSVADSFLTMTNNFRESGSGINHIGIVFTSTAFYYHSNNFIPLTASAESNPAIMINDTLGWQLIRMKYKANGTEEFLTIGFFRKKNEILYTKLTNDNYVQTYFYVEDVSVIEDEITIPNVFTPNNDGENDFFDLKNEDEKYAISIFNRWGIKVFESDIGTAWDGKNKVGLDCIEGIYY
jgi:CHU_C Type IX secretion signal domain